MTKPAYRIMKRLFLLGITTLLLSACGSAETREPAADMGSEASRIDEEAVKAVVDSFLVAIGNYDLDALPPMFAPGASIGGVSLSDGTPRVSTWSFDEFMTLLRAREDPKPYQEPVSNWTVHVEKGGMAFVRADAILKRGDVSYSRNIDYFTLIRIEGDWRFLSASYVATPIPQE